MVTIIIITTVAATTIPTTFTIMIIITITTDNIEVVITTWTGTILSVLQVETHLILIMTLWGKYHFMMRRLGHRELTDLGPRAHRGRAVPTVSMFWWGPAPPFLRINSGASVAESGSILCTPRYSLGHTLALSDCLCTANLRSLPGSIHWSPSFSTQPPVSTTDNHLRLETASEVARTICANLCLFCLPQAGCYTLLWASEAPCFSLLISQPLKGVPRVKEPFFFYRSLPGVQVLSWLLFSPPFVLPAYVMIFPAVLITWALPPVFSRNLWELFHM